ncbi:type VI secretion protein VgrG, partial [Aggregatibacter aphrophilus ATCC 33389]
VVVNQEGITLIGNVRIEGELTEEGGSAEAVNPFKTQVYEARPLDMLDIEFS